ncbi:MAG: MFS transporter [Acidobacteria bacterium]|nr:MFS transporter [Acidobacteriota bacterium]
MRSLLALIRDNRDFRYLWFGQIVSQLGDWFNIVALFALLFELTGSATSVAALMVMQMLPIAVVGPVAGVIVDRFDRRRIMIAADIIRGTAVLGLLLVRTPETVWVAYAVTGVMVACSGFFEPARSATVPSIVPRDKLVAANAISTGTWSAMLAVGASLGGAVAALLGRDAAFIINAASFFASAFFLFQMRVPGRQDSVKAALGLRGVIDGLAYMRGHGEVARIALVKGGWAIVGGALLLLTVFGDRIFRIGDSSDAGIGILFGARGVGAFAGSLIVSVLAARKGNLIRLIAPAYFVAGLCYASLAIVPNIWIAAVMVVASHVFGSILWVSSNVLLQMQVPDEFRGRVFAAELVVLALVQSTVAYATAVALDQGHMDPRVLAAIVGLGLWGPALLWIYGQRSR